VAQWVSTLAVLALMGGAADGGRTLAAQSGGTRHAAQHTTHSTRTSATNAAIKNVFWQPNQMQQGSVAFFTVELEHAPRRVTATWIGKTLSFFHTDDPKVWYALAGADLETQPGSYDLQVTAVLPSGKVARSVKKVDVAAGTFTTGAVDVPENYVEPNEDEKKQIAADEVLKTRAFAHMTAAPLWSGNFVPAVNAKSTPSFGESRILNEEKTSLHRGTDFPVPEGTPVVAANSGTVVLAKELYYEGNCVIVDHGQRFFTIYMHLSKIEAAVGDKVAKGKRLGLSGATGRVTGPHMHLGVRWSGAYIDPVGLLAMTLPKTAAGDVEKRRGRAAHRSASRHPDV
jgi:murein DD-endopeptidase MepM/ murein hydrolase activator NlpD